MSVRLLLSLVLIAAVCLFILQNVGVVEIRFLFWSTSISRSLLLIIVLAVGILVGWLWHSFWRRAQKRTSGL